MTAFAYRKQYDLPRGYSVEFSLDGSRLECAWSPDIPKGKEAKRIRSAYLSARGRFIASLGINTLVLDL